MKKSIAISVIIAALACSAAEDNFAYSKYRRAPLLDVKTTHTVSVRDFGAIPDDGRNDFEAIAKAFDKAREFGGSVKIVFEKGVYEIRDDTTPDIPEKYIFSISNLDGAVIDGGGAELIVRNPNYCLLKLESCRNVIIENFVIDYKPLPFTEAQVIDSDEAANTLKVRILKGFPQLSEKMFFLPDTSNWLYHLDDNVGGRIKEGKILHNGMEEVRDLGDGVFDIKLNGKIGGKYSRTYDVGDKLAILARRTNKMSLFLIEYGADITFKNVTAYATPSFFFKGLHSEAMNFIGCRGLIREGRRRGGDADFIHLQNNKVGPWIENCVVEGIADDCLVFYTRPFYAISQDGTRVKLARAVWPKGSEALIKGDIAVGDSLMFLNPKNGEIFARAKVAAFDAAKGEVELDREVGSLTFGQTVKDTQIYSGEFTKGFVVKNNLLKNSRRYGAYWKGSNGIFENNVFIGLSHNALTLHPDVNAPNGPVAENVEIVNNTFIDNGFDDQYLHDENSGAISIYSMTSAKTLSSSPNAFRNIAIRDNKIITWNKAAMTLRNIDGLTLSGNYIGAPARGSIGVFKKSVNIENCRDVKTEN